MYSLGDNYYDNYYSEHVNNMDIHVFRQQTYQDGGHECERRMGRCSLVLESDRLSRRRNGWFQSGWLIQSQ